MKAYHTRSSCGFKTDQGCHIITEEVVKLKGLSKFRQGVAEPQCTKATIFG